MRKRSTSVGLNQNWQKNFPVMPHIKLISELASFSFAIHQAPNRRCTGQPLLESQSSSTANPVRVYFHGRVQNALSAVIRGDFRLTKAHTQYPFTLDSAMNWLREFSNYQILIRRHWLSRNAFCYVRPEPREFAGPVDCFDDLSFSTVFNNSSLDAVSSIDLCRSSDFFDPLRLDAIMAAFKIF